jgi:hypothetical protein
MKRLGLAWNVVQIAPERQAAKLVGAKPAKPAAPAQPEREPAGVA